MPTLEQQLADAIDAQNRLTQAVASYKSQLDSAVAGQKTSYDAWKANARSEYFSPGVLLFDDTKARDKTNFIGTDEKNLDSADVSTSKWFNLAQGSDSGNLTYVPEGVAVAFTLPRCISIEPGWYESTKYAKDKSRTLMQFVISNNESTSEQINARIKELGFKINGFGGWWDGISVGVIPTIQIAGLHPYSTLFARFYNVQAGPTYEKQSVKDFGGPCPFRVRSAQIFNIPYKDIVK